jgi:RNA polymerase sigma-70 factor (ECF subfamily)
MAGPVSAVSFSALYERHARPLYRFALALTGDAAEAEDLTAEAFLRVWEAGDRVDALTVRGYLVAIVRNLRRNAFRHDRRRAPMPADAAAPPADPAARVELARVLAALGSLPAGDREILLMRAEAELSYEEIAALAGGTPQAARVRVHRARKRLMEALCLKTP